jgi:hypothetical protein
MAWRNDDGLERRPVVVIEDHLYHAGELAEAIARVAPALAASVTICAIDRPGPDTSSTVADWARRFPAMRIVTLDALRAADLSSFARSVAKLVRPGGLVVQDVQLETLPFIPADRWWESIYVGATVRGLFAERPPLVRFASNKRGYDATFGKDLLDAGFDPRDVMDKSQLDQVVVPAIAKIVAARFPHRAIVGNSGSTETWPVGDGDRADLEAACDLSLWTAGDRVWLGGRLVGEAVALKTGSSEIETWRALIEDRIRDQGGVAVISVGERLAEHGAERAELTNLAARHIHTMRARMKDADAIVTANHRYQLRAGLTVSFVASRFPI